LEKYNLAEPTAGSSACTQDIAAVRDLVGYLYKSVKTILLYPPTNPLPGEFKLHLHEKLTAWVNERGPLVLTVRGDQFVYEGQTVHEESGGDDNFISTLMRDGVQKISFHPGLELHELDAFLGIIKRVINERSEDDDLVTLLWEASFSNIRYEAISELDTRDYTAIEQALSSRPAKDDTGKINYGAVVLEESSLTALGSTDGGPGGAPLPASRSVDAVNVTNILDSLADLSDDLSQVDAYLREATQFDPATSTIGIVFEILIGEEEVPAFYESCNILDGLYDRFIDQADFGSAAKIYEGVCELEEAEKDHSPARAKRLSQSRLRTADKLRIERMVRALNANAGCDLRACQALLTGLPADILGHLVTALGELEHFASRKIVCDVLAERGADRIDTIGNGIFDKRWYVVRNIALVLGNIGGAKACQYLEKAVQHADERVRREVIEALVRMDPALANRILRRALEDDSVDLRLFALRALAQRRDEETGDWATSWVLDKAFLRLEPTEQKEWLVAVARIRGDRALPTFQKLISGFALFQSSARQRLRGLAVLSLGDAGGTAATEFLEKLSQHRNARLRDSALKALHRMHHEPRGTDS
jgi:hypothetical protein